jgi:hypothetical protein
VTEKVGRQTNLLCGELSRCYQIVITRRDVLDELKNG